MPLGWRYNPDADPEGHDFKPQGNGTGSGAASFMQRLSIGSERDTKRVKLTSEPSSGSSRSARQSAAPSFKQQAHISPKKELRTVQVIDLDTDEDDLAQEIQVSRKEPSSAVASARKGMLRKPSTSSSEEQITLASFLSGTGKKQESSSEDSESSVPRKPGSQNPTPQKNSIMNPVASQGNDDGVDESDASVGEGEFIVERIVSHKMSDPRTHPGKKVTMLYETKWEGYDETTWEPVTSFEDDSVVMNYRRQVGLSSNPQQLKKGVNSLQMQPPNSLKPARGL
jgi:hypothetical protein